MSEDLTNIVGLSTSLRIPRQWLIGEADAGSIPFLQIGRQRLFNVEAVRAALAKRAAEFPKDREVCPGQHKLGQKEQAERI